MIPPRVAMDRRRTESVQVLVPDCRGMDQNFHDVTIVDMGDVPESHIPLSESAMASGGH